MTAVAETLARTLGAGALEGEGELAAWTVGGRRPEAVVSPADREGVAKTLEVAGEGGLMVIPVGMGSAPHPVPPSRPFVVLSTRLLSGLDVYEPADLTLTVGAGTTLGELEEVLEEHGQWVSLDPPGGGARTVGAAVATGAAGPLWAMYGAPRDNVLGLTVVTGDGRTLRLGGRVMKNVAGFDLVRLMVGSRGTLGVVVSASLRVFPRPEADRALVLQDGELGALVATARRVATAPVLPASASLVSGPPRLVVRLHGAADSVEADGRTLEDHTGASFRVSDAEEARAAVDAGRDGGMGTVTLRIAGLPACLGEMLGVLETELDGAGVAADVLAGRIRVGVEELSPEALGSLRARMEEVGGSVRVEACGEELAGEVGVTGRRDAALAELARGLKGVFDPGGTLPSFQEAG